MKNLLAARGCPTVFAALLAATLPLAAASAQSTAAADKPIRLETPEAPPKPTVVDTKVETEKYEDGTVRVERTVALYSDDTRKYSGPRREFYPSGKLFVDGGFEDGLPSGVWTYYHPNGELAKTVTYVEGTPNGGVDLHRPDGTLLAHREFRYGKRHGVWYDYAADGKRVLVEQHYKNGLPDGDWKRWYEDGTMQRQYAFKNGVRDGVSIEWNTVGDKRIEANYVAGKREGLQKRWTEDGSVIEETFKAGKLVE